MNCMHASLCAHHSVQPEKAPELKNDPRCRGAKGQTAKAGGGLRRLRKATGAEHHGASTVSEDDEGPDDAMDADPPGQPPGSSRATPGFSDEGALVTRLVLHGGQSSSVPQC